MVMLAQILTQGTGGRIIKVRHWLLINYIELFNILNIVGVEREGIRLIADWMRDSWKPGPSQGGDRCYGQNSWILNIIDDVFQQSAIIRRTL